MRRVAATAVVALALGLWPAMAHADETVVVPGTTFPATGTYLTYFGCTDLYHGDPTGPTVRLVRDDAAPLGRRAVSLDMPGAGTATGPVSLVESVRTATSTASVSAAAGSQGVAYVWFVTDDLEAGEVWAGRADLTTAVDGWQRVNAMAATYTWTKYEAASGEVLEEPGAASVADFTDEHGDGPGYLLTGFGCDGGAFAVDRIRAGTTGAVTTYDLEGWTVATSIAVPREPVAAGEPVTISGKTVAPSGRVVDAPLQLEARPEGAEDFVAVGEPVRPDADGTVATRVVPDRTTDYRWVFAETGYADQRRSAEARVVVLLTPVDEESSEPTTEPTESTQPSGSAGSSGQTEPSPSDDSSESAEPREAPALPEMEPLPEDDPSAEPTTEAEPSETTDDEGETVPPAEEPTDEG